MKSRLRLLILAALPLAATLAESGARSESQAPHAAPELEAAVRALVSDRSLKDAQIGVSIMDAETGVLLAQAGEHLALNPASNAKLYTAAAALAILHGSHRYQTSLVGTMKSGSVQGPLVLRGHGDPSLRSSDLWALVHDLKGHGVRGISGDIVVDQRAFDDQTTPPAFDQQPNEWAAFRAPVSAVALNGNTITFTVRPSSEGGPASLAFDPPGFVDVDGTVKTTESGADTVRLDLAPSGRRLAAKVGGSVSMDARVVRYTRRVDDPQLLAGYALKAILEDAGIKVAGDVKLATAASKGTVLARHESEPLSTLLYALGKNSDNFYAEMIFKSLSSEAKVRPGKSQESAELVTKWLERNELTDAGLVIKNGSGLFDANRTTAFAVTKLLRFGWQDPAIRGELLAQLAIGGVDGTLHKRFRECCSSHRAVRAKSGTLDDVIALSGYVLAPTGKHTVAFSIMFNKVSGHGASARAATDKLVEMIHARQWR